MKTIGIRLITTLTIVFVALACQAEKISQTQLQTQYSLEIEDLPKGWKFEGESWNIDYGGESYTVTYQITDHNFVSHTISMYPNEDQAREPMKSGVMNRSIQHSHCQRRLTLLWIRTMTTDLSVSNHWRVRKV